MAFSRRDRRSQNDMDIPNFPDRFQVQQGRLRFLPETP